MSKLVDNPKGKGKINRFEKGESGNPKGRPKSLINELKRQGKLSDCQAKEIIQLALGADLGQLKKIFEEPDMMIYFRIIAGDLAECLRTKNFKRLREMIDTVYEKPKQKIEHEVPKQIRVVIEGDEAEGDESSAGGSETNED